MTADNAVLDNKDIARFSRQLIVPEFGVKGQSTLKKSSVLIVGAGGLGCPAALYLAGAGIGHIGLVDYDVVEENNLHRQLLHCENSVGKSKVKSAAESLKRLNGNLKVSEYCCALDSSNALDIVKGFDVVIDGSDNVATRYLLSDACVLTGRPLVSGSALQMEGQLTVYNYQGGPCYRCLYPQPPPPDTVTNCSDAGVLAMVPGVIGVLQALETVKVLLQQDTTLSSRMLLFDGSESRFRNIKLRTKNKDCVACGTEPQIKDLVDYVQFCGSAPHDKDRGIQLLADEERITANELAEKINSQQKLLLIDVRSTYEFDICSLPRSVNVPLNLIEKSAGVEKLREEINTLLNSEPLHDSGKQLPVYTLCRRGNDSQIAVRSLQTSLKDLQVEIKDVKGGLHSWTHNVDNTFPIY